MKKILLHIIVITFSLIVSSPSLLAQQVTDIDGNNYNTVAIGSQVWMKENLKTSRTWNGTSITFVADNANWAGTSAGSSAYCWYGNNVLNKDTYGALYNWNAVNTGNLCPDRWHVPSDAEWTDLTTYVTGKSMAAASGWDSTTNNPGPGDVGYNQASNNASGFTALPGGFINETGGFQGIGSQGNWWTSTSSSTTNAWERTISSWLPDVYRSSPDKRAGISIRCVHNAPSATITCMTPTVCKGDGNYPKIWFNGNYVGTPPFTFTYKLNGGPTQTITTAPGDDWAFFSLPTTTTGIFTYSLVSVQDAYQTVAISDAITVTINPLPTASISGSTTVCQDAVAPNITFTGASSTAPYTFVYTVNGGSNQTITTTSGNSVTLPVPTNSPGTYTYSLVSVSDASSTACSQAQTGSAVVTVSPNPAITAINGIGCSGKGFNITPINGTNGIVPPGTTYSWAAPTVTGGVTGGASGSAASSISGTLTNSLTTTQTATYIVTPTSGGCTGTTFTVKLTIISTPEINNLTATTCSGAVFTVTPLDGVDGLVPVGTKYMWGAPVVTGGLTGGAPNGGPTYISGTLNNPTNTPQTATYTVNGEFDDMCLSPSFTITVTVMPVPAVTAVNATACSGTVFSITPVNGIDGTVPPGTTYTWSAPVVSGGMTGGLAGTSTGDIIGKLTNPTNVPQTATYLVTPTSGSCTGANFTETVTVNPLPKTAISGGDKSYCQSRTIPTISATVPAGQTVSWYDSSSGGNLIVSGSLSFTPSAPGTYYAIDSTTAGCVSSTRTPVTVTMNPLPTPSLISSDGDNIFCAGTSVNFTAGGGTNYNFRVGGASVQDGASAIYISDSLSNGQVVDVIVTNNNGCKATSAGITNIINALPTPTASNNGPIIPGTSLSLTGGPGAMTVYAWTGPYGFSSTLQSPVVSTNATTDMAGVYTLTVTNSNGCQSSATTTVTSNPLTVTNVNDNGIGSLRYAINYANSTTGVQDIITFNMPGYGPFTIQPQTALPSITDPVIIDGYSQPGASATSLLLLIEIDGTKAGTGSSGLTITSGNCTVRGLVINRFAGAGIQITTSGGNIILGNYIGVDPSGVSPEGNGGDGIQILNGTSNNKIGGTNPGEGNIISGNKGAGISILSNGATGNLISSNSIYSNSGLGIDLGGNGVTSNDTGDPDTGPNNLQNFPVLASVVSSTGLVTITGSLNSIASKVYNLQFFASKLANSSGYGEGQTFLGSANVTTGTNGNVSFTQPFSIKSSSATVITATATDPLGSTSEFSKALGGLQNQTNPQWPLRYTLNADGVPNITDGSDLNAVRASFQTWAAVSTATISFTDAGTTTSKYANANDGVNLVSFEDDQFPFSYGVLAVAAKTLKVDPTTQAAQIIDADIVVNPVFVNDIKYNLGVGYNNKNAGYFDIQSVITHEVGHVLGLLHSGVVSSTMFFTLGKGTTVRTLEQDDKSWASYSYPAASYNSTYGSISGNITYGYGGQPVAGALVHAINTAKKDSVHAYSDASGNYLVPGLIPGSYNIYIEPLDGNVNGYNLRPGNISAYIYANTVYTDYPGEFYSGSSETSTETTDNKTSVSVSAGATTKGINLITNQDITPPFVVNARATDVSGQLVNIVSNFNIRFSEPVDETSLSGTSCYLTAGTKTIGGSYTILGDSVNVVMFDPESALEYSTVYTLHITGGVKDVRGNALQPEFTKSFTTVSKDNVPPLINEVIPGNGTIRVFVTAKIMVFFSEPMNATSVEKGFTLNSGGLPVAGSFSWDKDNKSVAYTPSGSLKEGTGYTVILPTSITDLSGNQLASSKSYSFTTVTKAAPTITYLGPGNLSTGIPVTTSVVVDFSEPINIYTVNSTTLKLMLGNTQVTGTYEFLNDNSRVIFKPGTDLAFSQTYTIKLTNGILDVSQMVMKFAGSTTTFTTGANATVPDILFLDPPSGVVGAAVTIAGSGFDPNPAKNTITFNGVLAPVKTATLTTLTTEVPLGAMSGPVQVSVNGTASDNTMYFYLIPQSLDPCSNIIANTSTGTKSTHGTDVTPDGAFAYVTNPDLGKVTAVNLNTLQTTSITVGNTPMNVAINPLGTRAYVTNFNSHTVSVIDLVQTSPTYNSVISTISVGIEPYGVAVTPSGKRVYVANYYSGNVSMIDEDPNSGGFDHVVANVITGSKTGNAAITPDGAMVLVTGESGLTIIDSNPKDKDYNSVIANVSSGTKTKDVSVTPDAGLAIVLTEEGSLLVVNLHPENGDYSEAVISNVNTGTKGSNVKGSGDGLFVYVTDTDHDQLLVYQIGLGGSGTTNGAAVSGPTLILHNKIPVGKAPEGLVISANSDKLYVIDTNTSGTREITTVAICCGPITPSKAIGDLIISVQNMINNGYITKLRGYALIISLNSALRNIYANRPNLTLADLNAFATLVNTYIKNKQVTTAQGNALLKSVNALITQLKGTKSALAEPYMTNETEKAKQDLITDSRLCVIYPNPFGESVTINYEIAGNDEVPVEVHIMIYDIRGLLAGTLVDEKKQTGRYSVSWNGRLENGNPAPFGTYFVLLRTGKVTEIGKIMFIK